MSEDRDQSYLPVQRLYATDGIDLDTWVGTQTRLVGDHYDRLEMTSGVGVLSLDKAPDWIRCCFTNQSARPAYACGYYPVYVVAAVWDDPVYGNWLFPTCREHLAFIVDKGQAAVDLITEQRMGNGKDVE